mgnify:CR=1 FL=1
MSRWIIMLALVSCLLPAYAPARETVKHPRVAELEEFLRQTADAHLRSRFPSQPFQVGVSIDPLFRYENEGDDEDTLAGEDLPAMFVSREEIRDEWDDPSRSLHQLMSRVRKIKLELSLPAGMSDDEIEETKSSVQSSLHLIPGRDSIEVVRKPWQSGSGQSHWLAILGALAALSLLLGGNYLITQKSAERLSLALKSINVNTSSNGGGGGGMHAAEILERPRVRLRAIELDEARDVADVIREPFVVQRAARDIPFETRQRKLAAGAFRLEQPKVPVGDAAGFQRFQHGIQLDHGRLTGFGECTQHFVVDRELGHVQREIERCIRRERPQRSLERHRPAEPPVVGRDDPAHAAARDLLAGVVVAWIDEGELGAAADAAGRDAGGRQRLGQRTACVRSRRALASFGHQRA